MQRQHPPPLTPPPRSRSRPAARAQDAFRIAAERGRLCGEGRAGLVEDGGAVGPVCGGDGDEAGQAAGPAERAGEADGEERAGLRHEVQVPHPLCLRARAVTRAMHTALPREIPRLAGDGGGGEVICDIQEIPKADR
jgi:hypothetical protein